MSTYGLHPNDTSINEEGLLLGFRFLVTFFIGGIIPNLLDIRFQKVSGIASKVETMTVDEGGQNLYTHRLPKKIGFDNLRLERGRHHARLYRR